MYDLLCSSCREQFKSKRPDKLYCSSRCQSRVGRLRRKEQSDITKSGRDCLVCGHHFEIIVPATNRRYCSDECARKASKEQQKRFLVKNPGIQNRYNAKRFDAKWGVVARLRRRFPDLPKACQSCGEDRVLELAHRPEFKRNGTWRKMENTQPHMIWVLCPTCHKLLDKGICTQEELGLS